MGAAMPYPTCRRSTARLPVAFPVHYFSGTIDVRGISVDISQGGARLLTPQRDLAGSLGTVHFTDTGVQLCCEVTRVAGREMCLRFRGVSDHAALWLQSLYSDAAHPSLDPRKNRLV
jgi:hypothetical protein